MRSFWSVTVSLRMGRAARHAIAYEFGDLIMLNARCLMTMVPDQLTANESSSTPAVGTFLYSRITMGLANERSQCKLIARPPDNWRKWKCRVNGNVADTLISDPQLLFDSALWTLYICYTSTFSSNILTFEREWNLFGKVQRFLLIMKLNH